MTMQARMAGFIEATEAGLQSMQEDLGDLQIQQQSDRDVLDHLRLAYQELRQDMTAMQAGMVELGRRLDALELDQGGNRPEGSRTLQAMSGLGRKRGISDGKETQASKRSKMGELSPTRH